MSAQTPEQFIAAHQAGWARLEVLVRQATGGQAGGLRPEDIEELGRLYRQASSDLARARRDYPGDRLLLYLNRLVATSYSAIYRGEGWSPRRLVTFYTTDFPRLVRKQRGYILLAAALLFVPAIAAWIAVVVQPGTATVLLPAPVYDKVQGFLERHDLWTHIPVQERPYAATAIMTNNIQVTFLAFAGGMLAGVLTVVVLILNGINLGAVAGLCQVYGASLDLWSFVFPHGFLEMTVICMAGGGGLRLADAILRPGLRPRAEALRVAAREAAGMLLGGAGLLVVAGTIEGNLSPSETPAWFRLAFGLCTGVLLYAYLIFAGRRAPRTPRPTLIAAPLDEALPGQSP